MSSDYRAGFVTIVGRPNVGKSTILNALIGQKLAIVTARPQTTRDRIRGICAVDGGQLIFVDTPGIHSDPKALNRHMSETALASIPDVDVIFYVRDATRKHHPDDDLILEAVRLVKKPTLALLNKVDRVPREKLLPMIAELHETGLFDEIVPISALKHDGIDLIRDLALGRVPAGPALYPEDEVTDRPVRFLVAELIREQLMTGLRDELPWAVAVEVERFSRREDRDLIDIDASVYVERQSQKGIVVGKGGERIKDVSARARKQIEELVECQVMLRVRVAVEPDWTRSEEGLRRRGYGNEA